MAPPDLHPRRAAGPREAKSRGPEWEGPAGTEEPPCPAPDLPGREERQELGEGAPAAGSGGMGGGEAQSDLRQLLEMIENAWATYLL